MASVVTHAAAALALGKTLTAQPQTWRFWVLVAGSAVIPDADVIGFLVRIPYSHWLGHRGFSHSLLFALLWSVLVLETEFRTVPHFSARWWGWIVLFFLITASHGLFDALTNGGLGVAFFAPFDNTRYFLPWRPVEVSPIGLRFDESIWRVVRSELLFIWLPCFGLMAVTWAARRIFCRPPSP